MADIIRTQHISDSLWVGDLVTIDYVTHGIIVDRKPHEIDGGEDFIVFDFDNNKLIKILPSKVCKYNAEVTLINSIHRIGEPKESPQN